MLPFYLVAVALAGFTLLVSGVKGHGGPVRIFVRALGTTLALMAFFYLAALADKEYWRGFVVLLSMGTYVVGCGITALAVVFCGPRASATLSPPVRTLCILLGLLLLSPFFLNMHKDDMALWAYRRALTAGSVSPLAETLSPFLKPWGALAQLPPSPQKDKLIARIARLGPDEHDWEVLLSLSPSPERLTVIKALAQKGVHQGKLFVKLYDQNDQDGLEWLLQENDSSPGRSRLLTETVKAGRMDVMRHIFRQGIVNAEARIAPIMAAIDAENTAMLDLLLVTSMSRFSEHDSPLNYAVDKGNYAMTHWLLQRGLDPDEHCVLVLAVKRPDILALLLRHGADPSCTRWGLSPLHMAAWSGERLDSLKLLLRAGADKEARDSGRKTPLMQAVFSKNTAAFEALLEAGADLDRVDENRRTALHLAAQTQQQDIMTRILNLRPDLAHIRDKEGKVAAEYAREALESAPTPTESPARP